MTSRKPFIPHLLATLQIKWTRSWTFPRCPSSPQEGDTPICTVEAPRAARHCCPPAALRIRNKQVCPSILIWGVGPAGLLSKCIKCNPLFLLRPPSQFVSVLVEVRGWQAADWWPRPGAPTVTSDLWLGVQMTPDDGAQQREARASPLSPW